MKFKINFINSGYRRSFQAHKKEVMDAIEKCYANGDFVMRDDLLQFEKNLAEFTGAKYAVGISSGSDALRLSYKALGIKPGDEVITVGHVFISPIEEIVHWGAKPILIDVREDGLMDETLIEKAITKKTVGIVPVHLSGKVCNMEEIMRIARKHKLWVVEDACQALGARQLKNHSGDEGSNYATLTKMAGTIGDIGCFSFIAPKTLGTGGDGGGIVTNNRKLYERILLLRNHWNITQGALHGHQPKQPRKMEWGHNARLDNVLAAVLNVKLKYYPDMLVRREDIAMIYNIGLADLPIELPTQKVGQIYQEYIIRLSNINKFKKFMDSKRIELLIRDTTPNHIMYKWYFGNLKLPITEKLAKQSVRLPTYPELTNKELVEIINAVREFFGENKLSKKLIKMLNEKKED
jgi:dTDP-4-amino-4,6-dideoxygalactose transaminase